MKDGRIRVGLIAWDCYGAVLGAWCLYKNLRVEPQIVETMAALYVVQFSKEVSFLMCFSKVMHMQL